jgi:hypothetical protein
MKHRPEPKASEVLNGEEWSGFSRSEKDNRRKTLKRQILPVSKNRSKPEDTGRRTQSVEVGSVYA